MQSEVAVRDIAAVAAQTGSMDLHGAPGTESSSAPSLGGGPNPLGSLRGHPILALATFAVIAALGLPFAWIKGKSAYSTSAVIFVSPRFLANLQDDKEFELQSNSQYREYVQQNVRTINRYDIVSEALNRMGDKKSLWIKKGEGLSRSIERLQGALEIVPIPDTYQIAVSLEGEKPEGLAEIVNSVVDTFIVKAKSEELYASDRRVANLVTERGNLQEEISQKQARRTEIAQELGVSTFTENYANPYDKLLIDAKEALAEAKRQRIQAEAQLGSVDSKQRPEGLQALQAYAQDLAGKDPALTSFQANLNARRTSLMSSISGLATDHPGRKAAERELADLEREHERVFHSLLNSYSNMLMDQRQAEAYKTNRVENKLDTEVHDQESKATWFTRNYQDGLALGLEIDRTRKRLDSIEDRISFLSLEHKAPGFMRVFSEARTPDLPVKGGRKKLFGMVLIAALIMGLAAPTGADFTDPRLHTPASVHAVLGFAPLAWLMEKSQAGEAFSREQICRLANRISQEQQSHGSRIFAFTSVKAGGGTTSIVTETAMALTRLGIPALAVEANAYRSDPRYRSPRSRGLAVALRGTHTIDSVITPGDDEFPDHVPVGDIGNERNLPDILSLVAILREASKSYGVILVDLPPILASVDAELIARTADVTVLVVRAADCLKKDLQRAVHALQRLRPRAVSAIVNRVDINASAGVRAARQEFETGTAPTQSVWASPWLWR
jgi:Mrp family chromosome partitioning ATPase/capsular polysaccharide biosynthesis protein